MGERRLDNDDTLAWIPFFYIVNICEITPDRVCITGKNSIMVATYVTFDMPRSTCEAANMLKSVSKTFSTSSCIGNCQALLPAWRRSVPIDW